MAKEILAVCRCPECGVDGAAEVKRTRAGLLYRWCTECAAQYFPRTVEMSDRLAKQCGIAGTGTGTGAPVDPAPVEVPVTVPEVVRVPAPPAKQKLWFEGLTK